MSSRKQVSKLSLDQIPKTIYFKKDFKLMLHSISLQQQIRSTYFTQQCANYTSIPNAHFTIAVNQVVQITTIDVTSNDEEKADLEVTLDLSHFAKGIKNDLAVTKFFVNKENILAPTSVNFYTAQMSNRKGTIEYKFVGKKTTQIDEEEYLKHVARKLEVTKLQKQLAENPQLKRLIEILDSKDEIIRQLQRKIASLIEQTRKLAHTLQREQSEQKKKLKQGLNLNLNINASNNYHMKKLNDKLTQQNEYLHKRIESLEEQLEEIDTKYMEAKYENNILHIEMGKKELEPQIIVNPTRIMANGERRSAIKMQTQMKMAEMRKQNKFSDYQNVMQQEKRQIQVEKLRYENESLKEKYTQALNELRAIELERNTEASKFKSTQLAINKQKQMYKSKYYEMQDSFTKQEEELSITKEKAKLYEVHVQKIEELERHEVQNKKKLEEREKANQELTRRCKRYEDKFSEIEGKWEYYRQMENEFEIIKRKNYNLNKMNERFEIRVQELKKFALKLENAYYQRKAKNQTDEEFDQFYQKQLQQRLQATFRKLRQYQKQYYEEQQKQLNQSKKQTIDFYLKRILDEQQRIQENIGLNEQEKSQMKKQKQDQVNHIKEQKLQEFDKQLKKYQVALNKLVSSEEYMPKGLNEKITYLQDKMRKFQFGEFGAAHVSQSSQSQLKNTIDRLNDSVRAKQSQITELKRTMGKMSDGGNLLKVTNIETTFANQRKSMIEQMAKSRQIFSKSFDDLKRANAELLKQKSTLQIELQNYKFKQEKLILKHSERQRQLQRMSKKNSDDFKRRIGELQKALQRKSDEAIKHKLQKQELKDNMNNLISQLNTTAELLQKRQQDNLNLQGENDELKNRIQQYQQAEKSLMQQVKRIKEEASFNQKQFKSLLQQRNEQFLQIQRIKNTEIQKLQRTIEEMQHKLQTQLTQLLHTKQNLQKLQQQCSQLESHLQETKVSYNIVNENYHKVQEQGVLRIHQLEQTNQMLEKNMMELAEHLKDTELQLSQLKVNKESLEKQLSAIVRIKDDMGNQQKQFKLKQRKYEQIIEQQNLKLSQLQHKYQQISRKVYQVQRQNESLNIKFIEKDSEVTDLRQKLNKKYDEVNEIKSVKFDLQMHVKAMTVEIEKLQQDKSMYEEKLHALEEDIEHLKEQLESRKPNLGVSQVTIKGQKSMLRPPPKTNLMTGSNFSQDEMQMSKMSRRSPKLLTKKQINEDDPRSNILIEEAVSLRGTQVNELNQEEHHHSIDEQIRNRMWTVNETDEHFMGVPQESREMPPHINSRVNLHYTESQEDANLDSEMDVREGQRSQAYMRSIMLSQRLPREGADEQMHASEFMRQAESLSSNAMIEQYMKEIQTLKTQNQRLEEDNHHLSEENNLLKDKISALTGNVEEVEKKNLLISALGLTGGIFMKAGQRASIESNPNEENPGIPVIKLKTGGNSPCLTPPIGSKETIRIEDNHSVHNHSVHNSVIRAQTYSKKSSINSPSRSPKLSPRGKQAQQSLRQPSNNLVFARSSVQQRSSRRQSLEGHLDQQNDKMHELQLIVQQLEQENKQLREALDQEHAANEKLMQEIVLIQEAEEEQNNMLQEKIKEVEDVNGYWEGVKQQLEGKIEKLVEEQIEKEGEEVKLLKAFEEKNEQLDQLNRKIQGYDRIILDKDKQISQLNKQIQKSYAQYRKYQEESQLQILQLKQTLTHLAQQNKSKTSEVELIAEDYFQLSNKFKELDQQLKQKQQELRQRDRNIADITAMYNDATEEIKKFEELRRNTQKQIHELENELLSQQASMTDVNKATSMSIKKYQIKLNAIQQQKTQIRQKLSDRQSIIQSLKHQIALYNQQTFKLKQLNNQLSLQLQRTQKQLKDIMKSYEDEFANLNHEIQTKVDSLNQYNGYIKEKDEQISLLNKQVRKLQAETREAVDSSLETKQAYEKFRTAKMTEVSNLMAQIQVKNDEYQKLKVQYEKDTEEYFVKEGDYLKKLAMSEQSKKGYKEKLLKYQTVLQELEAELSVMSQRPTKQQLDELQFQNDLYKNRIEELQEMLREFAPQAQMNKFSNSQQGIALEYKRYKMQKDRELEDLTNEIDKYALKINQLEQNNFMLKKQCEKMNEQMRELLQINAELKDENFVIKEDMHQLKEEVEFYKGKRIENLSKLLNDTM